MSSKTITKTTVGIPKPNNGLQWSPGVAPRLSKAKSSPNVSKTFTAVKQSAKTDEKPIPRRLSATGNRAGSSKTSTPPKYPPTKPRSNVTVVQIQSECPTPATRASLNKTKSLTPRTSGTKVPSPRALKDQKKKPKDSPLSCSILEDRALLKKGLQTTPEKLPRKPEELRKKTLNRSTSLWNVPVDEDKGRLRKSFDGSQKDVRVHKVLDRTSSLWNVSTDPARIHRTKSITGLKPSRIPLSTQLFGLGQSLADLTQVDRNAEKIVQKIIDLDEVDRSMDEHIYENCQEAVVKDTENLVYDNCQEVKGNKDLVFEKCNEGLGKNDLGNEKCQNDLVKNDLVYGKCQDGLVKHDLVYGNKQEEMVKDDKNLTVYENCQVRGNLPIYENFKIRFDHPPEEKKKLARAKSAPVQSQGSLDLEKRAQELMSQLDEDDDTMNEIFPEMRNSAKNCMASVKNCRESDKNGSELDNSGNNCPTKAEYLLRIEDVTKVENVFRETDVVKIEDDFKIKVVRKDVSQTRDSFRVTTVSPRDPLVDVSKIKDISKTKDVSKTRDIPIIMDISKTKDVSKSRDISIITDISKTKDISMIKDISKKKDTSLIKDISKMKDTRTKEVPKIRDVSKSREDLRTRSDVLQKAKAFAKSQESLLKKDSEMSIQEIRRNWEKQIKKCQEEEPENENRRSKNPASEKFGKKAKDIGHLVKFFNTKNTEATKEVQDSWTKIKDSGSHSIKEEQGKIKNLIKEKDDKCSGYVSDGNCSEDSGHMSNENENEEAHQELKNLGKSKRFLEEIIQDLDHSLEHTIEVFKATPIVQRFIPPEEEKVRILKSSLSTSSGASSIDSWEETLKVQRGNAEKGNWKTSAVSKTNGVVSSSMVVTRRPQIAPKPAPLNTSSQIFFRAGALERLESQRDEKLTGHIILLQARCRGYLARRKLNTLKLQDLAVRCIQRNVRKLMSVREWPWWRLYVKIAPLLNVHRTEDQLKARQEELEILRAKVERLEQERNHLKHDNDKLEAKLSEMTADFAEEHSTSTLAAERIDAETSERLRLERELQDVTEANKNLQQATERLEMELLYARAADLNGIASDGEDGEDGGVYKQRYEHAMRELEFFKRKMAQQHEDDLEQLVGLKKQLEKKLADAYEEVEEQRQVVGQWKRRVQKLNGEMHDLRLLLEEQTARNNLLEKKQRKFDSETQNLMDDLRQEKAQRERLAREKEIAIAEKFTVEQNLSDARLEIELKEERLHTLTQELEELTFGGKTEEEVAQLKKAKHELEKKSKDQEEELDDLAGQVQLLEQAKLRLEMSIEQQRKEMRKEMQQRDEELEDVRGNAHKKVKSLEAQLENEHEERTILLREKHDLERRLVCFEEQDRTDRAAEAEMTQRLKRDLKRTKALLRDAQTMLERSKGDSTGKAALRQLKNQLEDAECARAVAVKAKQALEQDLNETQAALEEATRQRSEAEDRANSATRERTELLSQLEENEEELAEVLKKYRAAVQQVSSEQAQLQETQVQIAALEAEKSSLKDQLTELSQRLESVEQLGDPTANSLATRRLEFRTKELESKLELEQTTRARLETQIARLKESVDKLQTEASLLRTKEQTAQDAARRLQRSLRETREEAASATAREQEATRARRDVEKALEAAEAETKVVRDDLRLALQRIDDLQSAIQGELDLDCSEEATSENSDSD